MAEVGNGARLARLRKDVRELEQLATSPPERHALREGMRDPQRMSIRRQHAVALLLGLAGFAVWGAGTLLLRVLSPQGAPAWDVFWGMVVASWFSAMALPGAATASLALLRDPGTQAVAVAGATVGGVAGALLVWFLGGAMRRRLEARHGWRARLLALTERLARRGTYPVIAVLVAIPLFPRSVPVYAGGLVGLKLPPFLVAVALGSAVRAIVVLTVGRALGLFH